VPAPILETERLRLRPHRLADFDAYVALWQEPGVVRFIGGKPFTREQSWARFLRQIGMWEVMGFGFFVIEDKASGEFAGEAGFLEVRRDVAPSLEGTLECGWGLATRYQGRGMAEEAMRAALAWAGGKANLPERLTCLIDEDHAASQHVAGKLGFTPFAHTTYNGAPVVLMERPRR
jgi:RimJ/RimL family protein N-acetyltransferase